MSTKQKVGRSFIALLLVAALLLTGTFAWSSLQQQGLNQAVGFNLPGGRLHDNLEVMGGNFGQWIWEAGHEDNGSANLGIYVENYRNIVRFTGATLTELEANLAREGAPTDPALWLGQHTPAGGTATAYVQAPAQEIFVRLQVFEYMEFGIRAPQHHDPHHYTEEQANMEDTDPELDGLGHAPGVTDSNADREVRPLIPGVERYDTQQWTLREWNNYSEETEAFRAYFEWELGGQKYFMPTFNRDPFSQESDVRGDAVAHTANTAPLRGGEFINETIRRVDNVTVRDNVVMGQDVFPEAAGRHDFFATQAEWEAFAKFADPSGAPDITTVRITHEAQETLYADIMYMEDWYEARAEAIAEDEDFDFQGWVLDVDGWAYWSQPLRAGEATGLLINELVFLRDVEDSWYYAIHVESEMATRASIWEDFEEMTDEARTLLVDITGGQGYDLNMSEGIVHNIALTEGTTRRLTSDFGADEFTIVSGGAFITLTPNASWTLAGVTPGQAQVIFTNSDTSEYATLNILVNAAEIQRLPVQGGNGPDGEFHVPCVPLAEAITGHGARANGTFVSSNVFPFIQVNSAFSPGSVPLDLIFDLSDFDDIDTWAELADALDIRGVNPIHSQFLSIGENRHNELSVLYGFFMTEADIEAQWNINGITPFSQGWYMPIDVILYIGNVEATITIHATAVGAFIGFNS